MFQLNIYKYINHNIALDQRLKLQSTFNLNFRDQTSRFAKMGMSRTKHCTRIKNFNLSHNYPAVTTRVTHNEYPLISAGINDILLLNLKHKMALRHKQ